jgi:hypothetical protein
MKGNALRDSSFQLTEIPHILDILGRPVMSLIHSDSVQTENAFVITVANCPSPEATIYELD